MAHEAKLCAWTYPGNVIVHDCADGWDIQAAGFKQQQQRAAAFVVVVFFFGVADSAQVLC